MNGSLGLSHTKWSQSFLPLSYFSATLEEVFLHLGEEAEDTTSTEDQRQFETSGSGRPKDNAQRISGYEFEEVRTNKSSWQTFKGLIKIRILNKLRDPGLAIAQLLLPIAFCVVGVYVATQLETPISILKQPAPQKMSSKSLYPKDNQGFFYGFQNLSGAPLLDFEKNMPRKLNLINRTVNYTGLLDYEKDLAIFQVWSPTFFPLFTTKRHSTVSLFLRSTFRYRNASEGYH